MSTKKGRPLTRRGAQSEPIKEDHSTDPSDFLDPQVSPDGKRPPREPLTPEALGRIAKTLPKGLTPSHKETLLKSGLSEKVIAESGYFSVSADDIKKFNLSSSHGPALGMPYRNRGGQVVQVDLRFDAPIPDPERPGKKIRYLSPPGLPKVCDWPQREPSEGDAIFLVEGKKKSDAARSLGLFAIALPGIYGLGKRAKEARRDFEAFPWEDREIVVVFDTETKPKTKAAVEKSRTFTCEYLASLGAVPKVATLPEPEGPDGKMGLDDFFVQGGTKEDLFSLIEDPAPDWKTRLVLTDTGGVRVNVFNLSLVLANDPDFDKFKRTRFNDLTKRLELPDGTPIDTPTLTELAGDIEGAYKTSLVQIDTIQRVLELIGVQRRFHPIRDWLEALPPWDRTPRIAGFFPTYYGAKDSVFVRAVGKNFMIATVARIFSPGCKHDHVVVLEGPQGIGKSTSIQTLFGTEWATTARADISSKDFISGILGFWAIELSELSSLRRSQVESIKAAISATEDDVRLPYRRDTKRYPRQCVFIASTNEDSYLQDRTGNRRFWPIRCSSVDLDGLARDREQLFAEALFRFRGGETWWVVPVEEARQEQESRVQVDAWEELIRPWLLNKWEVTPNEIFEYLEIDRSRRGHSESIRLGMVMRGLGWVKKRVRKSHGLEWIFVPVSNTGTTPEHTGTSNVDGFVPSVPVENTQHFKEEKNIINTCTHDFMYMGKEKGIQTGTPEQPSTDGLFRCVPDLFRSPTPEHPPKPTITLTPEDFEE
jgi:putative DNA primase/helicase